jgi:histidinol-phosphate aminotransferase
MSELRISPRRNVEGLGVYVAGKPIEEVRRELGLKNVIKLASNENPFGCSPLAEAALRSTIEQVSLYPESMAPNLATRLGLHLGVDSDKVMISNGSDEIIRLLTRAYIRPGDEAIMADVTFPRYDTNVRIENGTPVAVPLIEGVHDLTGMLNVITDKTRMIFVCNPNNPTGTLVDKDPLLSFIRQVPQDVLLVIDEAYYEYVRTDRYLETIPLLDDYPNLIIVRTFSKIYGLASLRIGYGLMRPEIIAHLAKVKEPFNTNRFAQAAALASLDDPGFVARCAEHNASEREWLVRELTDIGLEAFPSHANFLMVKLHRSGKEVSDNLLARGIIVRSGHLLGYDDTIRVTIGNQEENRLFAAALRDIIEATE